MPAKKVAGAESGTGTLIWNKEEHKKAELTGLTIDNQSLSGFITMKLYDCFATDASKTMATGATQAAEYLGVSGVLSGRVRVHHIVKSGQIAVLKDTDLRGTEVLGAGYICGEGTTSDVTVVARYKLV